MGLRVGFLVASAIVHGTLLMTLIVALRGAPTRDVPIPEAAQPSRMARVFLPPKDVLQSMRRPPSEPTPARPTPPPLPAERDRISIGAPSEVRDTGPLVLQRETDLTAQAKGRPDAQPSPVAPAVGAQEARAAQPEVAEAAPRDPGLRMPAGPGRAPTAAEGRAATGQAQQPSLAATLRDLDRRLAVDGARGIASGTGQQMGPFRFDPEGADFTAWLQHLKNDVFRNWIVPPSVQMGARGRVELEFTVERDGRVSGVTLVTSSGTQALDRAAGNALLSSRPLALPADYRPVRLNMQVTFLYNEGPRGS